MGLNESIEIYIPVVTRNGENQIIKNWGYLQSPIVAPNETIIADSWPANLSEAELAYWGFSSIPYNSRKIYSSYNANLTTGNRIVIDGVAYDCKGSNFYNVKQTTLIVPVQGV